MSDLCPFPPRARARAPARAPVAASREHAAPWGLNRVPLDFRKLTELGWVSKLELGEEPAPLEAPAAPAVPPTPRPPALPRALARECAPETRSFTLWHDTPNTQVGFSHESAGPLPWPFRIVGVSATTDSASFGILHWGLYTNDSLVRGLSSAPQGSPIAQIIQSAADDKTLSHGLQYMHFTETGTLRTISHNNPATALIGATVHGIGKYITLIVGTDITADQRIGVTITVEEICPYPVEARATAAPRPPVRVAARAPAGASPGASAPRPYVIPQGGTTTQTIAAARAAGREIVSWVEAKRRGLVTEAGHPSTGAAPIMGGISPEGMIVQRWVLPDQPWRTFATAAEADVAYQASLISALPTTQRAAAAAEARRAAGQLIYGVGEVPTPLPAILGPITRL